MSLLRAEGVRGFIVVEETQVRIKTPSTKKSIFEIDSHGAELIPIAKIGGLGFALATRIGRGFIQLGVYENGALTDFSDSQNKLEEDSRRLLYFKKSEEEMFLEVKSHLEQSAQLRIRSESGSNENHIPAADQKLRLKELYESGILSKEDFDQAVKGLGA